MTSKAPRKKSWAARTIIVGPLRWKSPQFSPGPTHGKTQKDGLVCLEMSIQDNTVEAYAKAGKGAIKSEDGWQSLDEAAKDQGGGGGFNFRRFLVQRLKTFKTPAVEAEELAAKTKDLAQTDDVYTGDLTEEGAKSLLTHGRRGAQGQGPASLQCQRLGQVLDQRWSDHQIPDQGFWNDEESATAMTWTSTARRRSKSKTSARPKSRCPTKQRKK